MRAILSLAAVLLVAACATGEQAGDLREGMTPDQVTAELGRPDGVLRAGDFLTYQYTNRLISGWSWDRADYIMTFADDRLVQWGPGQIRQQAPNHGLPIAGAALLQSAIQPPSGTNCTTIPLYNGASQVNCY